MGALLRMPAKPHSEMKQGKITRKKANKRAKKNLSKEIVREGD
jgi:hypothetical protein